MSSSRRLFFALWPNPEQQQRWQRLAQQYYAGKASLVEACNIHLTLLFIGGVKPDVCDCLLTLGRSIHGHRFSLCLDHEGYWRKPRVGWWGTSVSPPALLELVENLRQGAKRCGLKPDSRIYRPHITLARKLKQPPPQSNFEPENWSVDSFALVESVSSPGGVRYQVMESWPLLAQD